MLLSLDSYKQCSIRLLKVLHKGCNMDMLRVLLIYPHSLSRDARPQDHTYISVKPLTAMLQRINVPQYCLATSFLPQSLLTRLAWHLYFTYIHELLPNYIMLEGSIHAAVCWVIEHAEGGLLRFSDSVYYSHSQFGTA